MREVRPVSPRRLLAPSHNDKTTRAVITPIKRRFDTGRALPRLIKGTASWQLSR